MTRKYARNYSTGGPKLTSMTVDSNTYYYMADGLGSVRNVVESDEDVANTYDYYAFGDSLAATENVTSPYRFTGRDAEPGGLGVYNYRNRFYAAGRGLRRAALP